MHFATFHGLFFTFVATGFALPRKITLPFQHTPLKSIGAGETGSMYVVSYKVRWYVHIYITLWSVQSVQR